MVNENVVGIGAAKRLFIGCASDPKFAEPTAVMLTSLDINGDVPEAHILVASFGLSERDQAMIRAGAGQHELDFIDVRSEMLKAVKGERFTVDYPLAVLGRLFIANLIQVAGARAITIDSDMIVNASLRPLADRDLTPNFFAAIHDPPRRHDVTYFNSGITMFDVDTYKRYDIANRCLQWLAEQEHQPTFPDQDALNWIVGAQWHRLARTWNYFNYNEGGFTQEDYETCKIAHFAGPKPWNYPHHSGLPLYRKYQTELHRRLAELGHEELSCAVG